MMQYDRIMLGRMAKEHGFARDTFEKVCRLSDVLRFIEQDKLLSDCLALKGGTAINLTIFSLPRLSVDIDMDFCENLPGDAMLKQRKEISIRIHKHMLAAGYVSSHKTKRYHALDSFVYEYTNAAGTKDNLKIEINYMLRCHVLTPSSQRVALPWLNAEELTVKSVAPIEIYASKIVALLNRTAPRDLYDTYNMLYYGLFDDSEQTMLRKCVIFYSAIGTDTVPIEFSFESFASMPQYRIKTDLLPVLRNGVFFDVEEAKKTCIQYLSELLLPTSKELEFWTAFGKKEYHPELLFDDPAILARIAQHPMALWKCSERTKSSEQPQL